MNQLDQSIQRVRQMPRALQWALIAAVGLLLFAVWADVIQPRADAWNRHADGILRDVKEVRASEADARELRRIDDVVTSLGETRIPPNETEGTAALHDIVNAALDKHGASTTNREFSLRPRGTLPKTALFPVTRGKPVKRYTLDLDFNATPEVALAIIAELESSPYVESVNSVRMTRDTAGHVKVALTIEAWVISSASAGRTA